MRGILPNSSLFRETEKGGRGKVQKLDIFHGCHKCMVPYGSGDTFLVYHVILQDYLIARSYNFMGSNNS